MVLHQSPCQKCMTRPHLKVLHLGTVQSRHLCVCIVPTYTCPPQPVSSTVVPNSALSIPPPSFRIRALLSPLTLTLPDCAALDRKWSFCHGRKRSSFPKNMEEPRLERKKGRDHGRKGTEEIKCWAIVAHHPRSDFTTTDIREPEYRAERAMAPQATQGTRVPRRRYSTLYS